MGNYTSCTLIATSKHSSRVARIILPNGEIRRLDDESQVKAAELMLEHPNYFVVNSKSLQVGRRFFPLHADEDLEMANVYVMFLMKRLNSVITADDMGVLLILAAKRVTARKCRVLPEEQQEETLATGGNRLVWKLNLEDIEDDTISEFQHRLSLCRSRKPLLETITEEPVCSQ